MVERLFLAVPRGCLRFVIVEVPDHTHLLFLKLNFVSDNIILIFSQSDVNIIITSICTFHMLERSGSVEECLTRDRGTAGSSLTGVTALCP